MKEDRIGIIGGGLGGLAAACTLAARGHSVILFEANEWLGGKAAVWTERGYRFDMGPTILTLPSVLRRIFAEAGERLEDHLDLVRLDPQWRSFFEDGSVLDLESDVPAMAERIARFTSDARASSDYERFMKLSHQLHDISDRYFFNRSIGGLRDMFDARATFKPGTLSDVLSMRLGATMGGTIRRMVPDKKVAQMMDHFAQYVGSAPDNSPAVLCGIAHMQTEEGVWYPLGGTRAIPVSLAKLASRLGVEMRTSTPVRRILADDKRVLGVETGDGERVMLSAVVANCDSVRGHRELLAGHPAAKAFLNRRTYEPACSGVVLYLGLDRGYEHLLHHNFVFSRSPEEEFEFIYRRGEPAADPTCYVCAPARTEPSVAPAGGEALYVLVHTPFLRPNHAWGRMLPGYRKVILDKLARTGGMPDLEERIVAERVLTPEDIHRRYHVLNGAIYGLASHGRFMGAFKPANHSPDLAGLYLAGGSAHPGPGMPMVMMSGWIAADRLDNDGLGGAKHDRRGVEPHRVEQVA